MTVLSGRVLFTIRHFLFFTKGFTIRLSRNASIVVIFTKKPSYDITTTLLPSLKVKCTIFLNINIVYSSGVSRKGWGREKGIEGYFFQKGIQRYWWEKWRRRRKDFGLFRNWLPLTPWFEQIKAKYASS